MRRQDDTGGILLLLFLFIALPIMFFVWIIKAICKASKSINISSNKKTDNKSSWIPSAKDIDEYEMYEAIFDDDEW